MVLKGGHVVHEPVAPLAGEVHGLLQLAHEVAPHDPGGLVALDGAALGGQGQAGADLQHPAGPLLLLVGAQDDAGALQDLLSRGGDGQRRAAEARVQLAGEEVAHGQAAVRIGQQVGLVEQLQAVQVGGHVHVDARGRGVGVGLDAVNVQEPAGGRPVASDDRLVGGVGASVEGVEVADEVCQEAVSGLVVVDAARAAALAIPVAAVSSAITAGAAPVAAVAASAPSRASPVARAAPIATVTSIAAVTTGASPITAVAVSAPVVPAGTASLAALSHGGNPTHPPKRVPASPARTTSPPEHPQVPPTAT